ncbi:MAG: asparaginase [Cytophagales bacterium]|nr:asparaginase [Cytophagales bacterium]
MIDEEVGFSDITWSVWDEDNDEPKSRVCIVFTGGTIGMVPENPNNPNIKKMKPAELEDLMKVVPELGKADQIRLGMISFDDLVDSSDVTARHWMAMANIIDMYYQKFDGFVILHGTDTMAFTTSALSFMLNNLAKPVVVTGSQLPITDPRTDAVQNLVSAVKIAGYKATGQPLIPEVSLCFRDHLLRGNRSTKFSSSGFRGFMSPNFPALGKLGEHIDIDENVILKPVNNEERKFFATKKLDKDIKVIPVNPNITPQQLERDLKTKGIDGVILLTYGTGNMQTSPEFIEVIETAVKGGEGYAKPIPVLNVTQCSEGTVEMGLYEASSGLLEAGVSSGLDLTYEAALIKLNWALTRYKDIEEAKAQLQFSVRGEQSKNLHDIKWTKVEYHDSSDDKVILTNGKSIPGKYQSDRLNSAILRIQGMEIEPANDQAFEVRIFINEPNADVDTPVQSAEFVKSISDLEEISENSNLVCDASNTAKTVIDTGGTVSVTIVAIGAKVKCRSIFLSLYTDSH